MQVTLKPSPHPCWKCGGLLHALEPPISGWRYHCQTCQHLTSPSHALQQALAEKPKDAAGVVAAVACRIDPTR